MHAAVSTEKNKIQTMSVRPKAKYCSLGRAFSFQSTLLLIPCLCRTREGTLFPSLSPSLPFSFLTPDAPWSAMSLIFFFFQRAAQSNLNLSTLSTAATRNPRHASPYLTLPAEYPWKKNAMTSLYLDTTSDSQRSVDLSHWGSCLVGCSFVLSSFLSVNVLAAMYLSLSSSVLSYICDQESDNASNESKNKIDPPPSLPEGRPTTRRSCTHITFESTQQNNFV
jgi:hypothetical protein